MLWLIWRACVHVNEELGFFSRCKLKSESYGYVCPYRHPCFGGNYDYGTPCIDVVGLPEKAILPRLLFSSNSRRLETFP